MVTPSLPNILKECLSLRVWHESSQAMFIPSRSATPWVISVIVHCHATPNHCHWPTFFPHSLFLSLPLLLPPSLYYCQAVKWMLAYFKALLSNSLLCTGQVRGSAERDLAAYETSTLKQLAQPPTVARRMMRLFSFTSQTESIIYIRRSSPTLSKDFRSANVERLNGGQRGVKRAGLWQRCLPSTCSQSKQTLKLDGA